MTHTAEMEAVFEALLFASPDPQAEAKLLEVFPEQDRERAAEALEAVLGRYRVDHTGGGTMNG
jgi:chromosome segregation and condensation protein ScpB